MNIEVGQMMDSRRLRPTALFPGTDPCSNLHAIKMLCFLFFSALMLPCDVPAFAGLTQPAEPAVHISSPPPLDQPQWRTFISEEGHFSVLVPSTPTSRNRLLPTSQLVLHELVCRSSSVLYALIYEDLPADEVQHLSAEQILTLNDNATLKLTSNTLISKSAIALGGYPGHELITNHRNGQRRLRHTYLIGTRLFTLDVVQPPKQAQFQSQAQSQSAAADKFFKSFALLPAKMPLRNR